MGEKYDERPHKRTVYFAIGDRENPYNWSVVSLAHFFRVDVISNDTDIESPLRNAKFSYLSLVSSVFRTPLSPLHFHLVQ